MFESNLSLCSSTLADCRNNTAAEEQKQLAWLVMETLTVLLQGSSNTNAGIHALTNTYTHAHVSLAS